MQELMTQIVARNEVRGMLLNTLVEMFHRPNVSEEMLQYITHERVRLSDETAADLQILDNIKALTYDGA
jgi:hypothetical protein